MAGGPILTDRIKKRIREMDKLNISQVDVAYILNISQNSVSRVLKEFKREEEKLNEKSYTKEMEKRCT